MLKYLPNILVDIQLWMAIVLAYAAPFVYFRFRVGQRDFARTLCAVVLGGLWLFGLANFFYLAQDPENFREWHQTWPTFWLLVIYAAISLVGLAIGNVTADRTR